MLVFDENREHFLRLLTKVGLIKDGKYTNIRFTGENLIRQQLKEASSKHFFTVNEKIASLIYDLKERPTCLVCGIGKVTCMTAELGFRRTCSLKCAANDPLRKERTKKTVESNYGGVHFTQNEEWQKADVKRRKENGSYQKGMKTFSEKHNVDNRFQMESVKEKIKKTHIERYGVENPLHHKDIKAKVRETTLKSSGAFFNPAKQRKTMIDRYGVENPLQHEDIKSRVRKTTLKNNRAFFNPDKQRKTMIERYGVEHYMQNPQAKECHKRKRNMTEYSRLSKKLESIVIPLFTKEEFNGCDKQYNWKCVICSAAFQSHVKNGHVPRCFTCYPISRRLLSSEIAAELENLFQTTPKIDDRSILDGKEIDILFEDLKIGFEINGVYWHSDKFKDARYHQEKSIIAAKKGVRLIHIFEDQWAIKKDIILNKLRVLSGRAKKIHARECEIRRIAFSSVKDFLNSYHLAGEGSPTKTNYGLFYKEKLISVATFGKPRFNKNYQWELIRFCTFEDYVIVGGLSKILKKFQREFSPENLLSYADFSWSAGNAYEKCGFNLVRLTCPGYFYSSYDNVRFSRYQATAKKLNEKLGTVGLSEKECAEKLKLHKIYDCGNLVFVKEFRP